MDHQMDQTECALSAFEAFYRRHAPGILASVRQHISSPEDAEDLLMEIFLAALQRQELICNMGGEMQLAWLRRVAHNKLVDFYRRTVRRLAVPIDEHMNVLHNQEQEPEFVVLRQEQYAWLHTHLNNLSEAQKEVLHLRFIGGLRCVEIAALLHKREGAIRMLLARALNSLRSHYEYQGKEIEL
jgi:RNA polymerase sigma-70 factor (ECF subfamily)